MELKTLQSFIKVAELLSFSKAANKLGYSQAAITIQIRHLEEELHTRLFERFGKRIALTEKGELFLIHAYEILKTSETAIHALEAAPHMDGSLRIGTIDSLCASHFSTFLKKFHVCYPNVRFSIETSSPEILLDMLNHNILDLVYFTDEKKNDYNWIKLFDIPEEIVFVASPQNPITTKKQLHFQDIIKEPLLLTEREASYRMELEEYAKSEDSYITPVLEIGNTDFIIRQVIENLGISFLPDYAVQPFVDNGSLRILKVEDFHISSWRQAVYHKNKWITPELLAFIRMLEMEAESV